MRLLVAVIALGIAPNAHAQQAALDRIRLLSARDDGSALSDAVRQHPDAAREIVRRLLIEVGRRDAFRGDSALLLAQRVAGAYANAWQDSFPLAQVARFSAMPPARRSAKLAADSVRRAGNEALGRDGAEAALVLWRQALQRSTAIADSAGVAAALGNIGAGWYGASQLDSAELYHERARRFAEAIGDALTAANSIGNLASVARDRGDLRRAQALYARALELRGRIGDFRGTAADHNNLGLLSAELDDLADARARYEQALALARRHDLTEAAAAALTNLGNAASVEAEYADAARHYGEALAIYRAAGSDADAALVLHNLGLLALRRGDYRTALARLEDAFAIFTRVGTIVDLVLIHTDIASVSSAAGDLEGALQQLRRAEQQLTHAPPDPELAADVALAHADLATQLNNYPEAERQYARAEALYRRAQYGAGQAEAQHGHALLLVQRGQYARALELLRAVERTQAASGDLRPAALTQLVIGHIQQRQGDLVAARRTLQQAVESVRAVDDGVAEAIGLNALGAVELEAGAPLASEALHRRGLQRLQSHPVGTVSWQLRAGLGRALRARGALADAADELHSAIEDIERIAMTLRLEERRTTFLVDKWDVYAELALVEHARGEPSAAFAASERMRARQMLDLLARGRVRPPVARDSSLAEREQDLRRRVGELMRRLETDAGAASTRRGAEPASKSSGVTREALARAQEQYAQLLLELRDNESDHAAVVRGEVASWHEVARRLATGEALLEFLVSDSTTIAFVVTHDTLRVIDLNIGRHALESLIDFTRGTLVPPKAAGSRASPPWRSPLRRLYQHLVAPIEDAGALAGVRRLIIVPHAELHYLPFAALIRPGAHDEFLIERYQIGYAPSASVWIRLGDRPRPHATGVLALAPRTRTLPGSRAEVESIRALYGSAATVLTNDDASEPAFRAAAPRFGIVHLATYGVLNKHNPLFSYVALNPAGNADGRLEVHEVFGLALNARLLVLSACQTALASGAVSDVPAGDDWVGLVRAFLGAGAANVIATLWPVDDRSTALVMERLHRALRSGAPEVTALTDAQRAALRNPATADPFYWAGFVLVGGR